MRREGTPILDSRDASRVLAELLARRPAYLPEWLPAPEQGGWALLQILARYAEIIIHRLNQAPDRNKLAFLDMLGISLIPAQPARAPVVFEPMPNAGNGRVPSGIRLGAEVPGQSETLMFETESGIAMAAARLVEVKTLWSARDEYADHTLDYAGGRSFELFAGRKPVPHELYLAHDTLLAFAGRATVEIEFELPTLGSEPLAIAWEYWDGQTWRPFADDDESSRDGTRGLTRGGVVTLRAECGDSKKTTIHGIEAYWIRGRLNQALPPDAARILPEIDRVRLRSSVERPGAWNIFPDDSPEDYDLQINVRYENGSPIEGLVLNYIDVWPPEEAFYRPMRLHGGDDGIYWLNGLPEGTHAISMFNPEIAGTWFDIKKTEDKLLIECVLTPGIQPEFAFADGSRVDVTKSFYPLGQRPQPGSTFYFSSEEIFSKPGAVMTVVLECSFARDIRSDNTELNPPEEYLDPGPQLHWEYWDGKQWVSHQPDRMLDRMLDSDANPIDTVLFTNGGQFEVAVPLDMKPTEVNGQEALWMRV